MRDDILKAMDKGEVTISVFADYLKVFDTIDYDTLIHKYGDDTNVYIHGTTSIH